MGISLNLDLDMAGVEQDESEEGDAGDALPGPGSRRVYMPAWAPVGV